jgi:predicted RecB family nuclease
MLITNEIFQAFLKCETKSYLKLSGEIGTRHSFTDWRLSIIEDFTRECRIRLCANYRDAEYLLYSSSLQDLENNKYRLVFACTVQAQNIQAHIQALERISSSKTKYNPYIPIRFIPSEKITKHDKLQLAFDALALSIASGKPPLFGKIIHGNEYKAVKIKLAGLMKAIRSLVERITAQIASSTHPQLILNKHCGECEFQPRCRQIANEKDELSLLSGMTEKERKKQHEKGIFSVTQLSYTFRPRRKAKHSASNPDKYNHALKALAIREGKIHVAGRPELSLAGTPVYLDVEGDPDRAFYYLIGMRIKNGDSYIRHSFWADEMSGEKEMWRSFLLTLAKIEHPHLLHYGSYETTFLKRMKERYGGDVENSAFPDQLIAKSINILAVIYAQIYFPTYTNGLKEISRYLGFQWSDSAASGLNALILRSKWESFREPLLKQKLITYNAEDCEALERVTNFIFQLCRKPGEAAKSKDADVIYTDSLKLKSSFRFGTNDFTMPELEYINHAAYWSYQRSKIYLRSSKQLKRASRKKIRNSPKALPINKVIECPPDTFCALCGSKRIYKYGVLRKVVHDLKFSRTGIKRWVVKYFFNRYRCKQCSATFVSQNRPLVKKFGPALLAYTIYQIIELQLPQTTVTKSLNQLFGFNRNRSEIQRQKVRAAELYQETYERILNKIVGGKLIHADETKISIEGKGAYVWVLTNLEEVAYFYTETREGEALHSLLQEFKGVLVSDFYAAYDAIDCPQQKCLIHLIRDLNDDLLKQPFNEELTELVQEFVSLLKPMIETIDRFRLKTHFLRKHKAFVERFYKRLSKRDYKSDIAIKYRKRFERNRDKLFTFLNYDGIPWNNNNAEHAIKAFATLRNVVRGTSSGKGIREYLTLLSICQTCKYKEVNFLDFLRSGEKDIDNFMSKTSRLKKI